MTAWEILLETDEWRSHLFPANFTGQTRSAQCNGEFSVAKLTTTYDNVPTCVSCRHRWGAHIADMLEKSAAVPARVKALLESFPEGTWVS
ncbi:hypothetical protein [Lentzea sp. E54]|uniref:hypothetical protein n=1 Tax=Lentzea xerophila TaxID=3435883 RepID=UPI003DA52536